MTHLLRNGTPVKTMPAPNTKRHSVPCSGMRCRILLVFIVPAYVLFRATCWFPPLGAFVSHVVPAEKAISTSIQQSYYNQSTMALTRDTIHTPRKPTLIIHIGPPKTGTTAIQCSLRKYRKELQEDFYYPETPPRNSIGPECTRNGTFSELPTNEPGSQKMPGAWIDGVGLTSCATKIKGGTEENNHTSLPECWTDMMNLLEYHREQGHNYIISNEVIGIYQRNGGYNHDLLASALTGWNVVVVVCYRRYFEWLPSGYNQHNKATRYHRDLTKWNGRRVPLFTDFLGAVLTKGRWGVFPFTNEIMSGFRARFNIHVMDIDDGDLEENFLCRVLPNAQKACTAYRNENIPSSSNPSINLHYDILAMEAYKQGLVSDTMARQKVGELARKRHQDELGLSANDFPLVCLSTQQAEKFLKRSLTLETETMGSAYAAEKEAEHRTAFARAIVLKKYCSVNATEVLRDDAWRGFFKGLRQ